MADPRLATGTTHAAGEVRRFPCKQCGAGLEFRSGQRSLQCPYCGYAEQIPETRQAIREYDLEEALLNLPHAEGWGTERRMIHCENCGATTSFQPGQVAGACAFCGSSNVVSREAVASLVRPESLAPFEIARDQAAGLFRKWIGGLWFRPNNLKHAGQLTGITGAYLPFWTFDAFTSAWWTAEAGYYYYVTETYHETDSEGRQVERTRQVRRVRWEPAGGSRQDFFDDELICASRGLPEGLIQSVGPFALDRITPYQPGYLAGFVAEEYQVDLRGAWSAARERMQSAVNNRCASDVPGDTHRNLQVETAFSQMTYKHLLLPVWVAAYLYGGRTYRFLVNGQTGRVAGEAPISWWKVAGIALLVTLVVLIILFVMHGR